MTQTITSSFLEELYDMTLIPKFHGLAPKSLLHPRQARSPPTLNFLLVAHGSPVTVRAPVPAGALSQIRNPYSKFKRNTRVHYTVSQEEAQRVLAKMPKMPVPKQKKEYQRMFKDAMEKARPKALTKEELAEIENFVGVAIEDGLEKRRIEEEKHYQMYQ